MTRRLSEEHRNKIRLKLLGIKRSEETKAKLRGNKHFLGKHHSVETRAKISDKLTGRKVSEQAKANMSRAQSGANNPNYGKHRSEETKAKIRIAQLGSLNHNYGKHLTESAKAKLRGQNNHRWRGDKATDSAGRLRGQRLFRCPEGYERHHIDGNPLNNSPENIMFVTRKQHMILDGRLEALTH